MSDAPMAHAVHSRAPSAAAAGLSVQVCSPLAAVTTPHEGGHSSAAGQTPKAEEWSALAATAAEDGPGSSGCTPASAFSPATSSSVSSSALPTPLPLDNRGAGAMGMPPFQLVLAVPRAIDGDKQQETVAEESGVSTGGSAHVSSAVAADNPADSASATASARQRMPTASTPPPLQQSSLLPIDVPRRHSHRRNHSAAVHASFFSGANHATAPAAAPARCPASSRAAAAATASVTPPVSAIRARGDNKVQFLHATSSSSRTAASSLASTPSVSRRGSLGRGSLLLDASPTTAVAATTPPSATTSMGGPSKITNKASVQGKEKPTASRRPSVVSSAAPSTTSSPRLGPGGVQHHHRRAVTSMIAPGSPMLLAGSGSPASSSTSSPSAGILRRPSSSSKASAHHPSSSLQQRTLGLTRKQTVVIDGQPPGNSSSKPSNLSTSSSATSSPSSSRPQSAAAPSVSTSSSRADYSLLLTTPMGRATTRRASNHAIAGGAEDGSMAQVQSARGAGEAGGHWRQASSIVTPAAAPPSSPPHRRRSVSFGALSTSVDGGGPVWVQEESVRAATASASFAATRLQSENTQLRAALEEARLSVSDLRYALYRREQALVRQGELHAEAMALAMDRLEVMTHKYMHQRRVVKAHRTLCVHVSMTAYARAFLVKKNMRHLAEQMRELTESFAEVAAADATPDSVTDSNDTVPSTQSQSMLALHGGASASKSAAVSGPSVTATSAEDLEYSLRSFVSDSRSAWSRLARTPSATLISNLEDGLASLRMVCETQLALRRRADRAAADMFDRTRVLSADNIALREELAQLSPQQKETLWRLPPGALTKALRRIERDEAAQEAREAEELATQQRREQQLRTLMASSSSSSPNAKRRTNLRHFAGSGYANNVLSSSAAAASSFLGTDAEAKEQMNMGGESASVSSYRTARRPASAAVRGVGGTDASFAAVVPLVPRVGIGIGGMTKQRQQQQRHQAAVRDDRELLHLFAPSSSPSSSSLLDGAGSATTDRTALPLFRPHPPATAAPSPSDPQRGVVGAVAAADSQRQLQGTMQQQQQQYSNATPSWSRSRVGQSAHASPLLFGAFDGNEPAMMLGWREDNECE